MSDEGLSSGKGGTAERANNAATPRRRPGDKPFIPFARFEDVVARCGHIEKFGLLPEGKDRFREGRRKKATSRDCKACREKKQRDQEEAAQQRRAEKEQRKMHDGERPARPAKTRLPDGSRFEVQYDAGKEQWNGTLTVPTEGGSTVAFTGSRSALFPLLSSLDEQYRATLG